MNVQIFSLVNISVSSVYKLADNLRCLLQFFQHSQLRYLGRYCLVPPYPSCHNATAHWNLGSSTTPLLINGMERLLLRRLAWNLCIQQVRLLHPLAYASTYTRIAPLSVPTILVLVGASKHLQLFLQTRVVTLELWSTVNAGDTTA